jgi:hypothetical protein
MFRKKQPEPEPAPLLVKRLKSIAASSGPSSYEDAPRNQRAPRSAIYRQATATLQGGEKIAIVIKNLSTTGCRIEFFKQTLLTPRIVIDEQSMSLHVEAHVKWQGEGAAGLRFIGAEEE